LDRWQVLHHFAFRYVDDDQSIMGYGAREMAHGRFHESCFYGQRYNTMLEGLVAVPLWWLGVHPRYALPLATGALALFPFLFMAAPLFRRGRHAAAVIVILFPVFLPHGYGMASSMPRGFVSGIFLACLSAWPLFSSRSISLAASPFFAILALFADPNAVLVVVPVMVLVVLEHGAHRRFLGIGALGALAGALLHHWGGRFYDARPHYQVHHPWELSFDTASITWVALRNYLADLAPVVWGEGGVVYLALLALFLLLVAYDRLKAALALLSGLLLLLLSFGINKVHNGIPSVFYPWSRMFLGIPVLMALFATRLPVRVPLVAAVASLEAISK
jgi:hypothetical protein